jgi:alkylation response protein AidB-like acyl-CoA dehydrogenase
MPQPFHRRYQGQRRVTQGDADPDDVEPSYLPGVHRRSFRAGRKPHRRGSNGFSYLLDPLNAERLLVASESVDDGNWFVDTASCYASERVVFDWRIGSNQSMKFLIAKAHINIQAAEPMRNKAASLLHAGMPCGAEAMMARYLASEASWEAAKATMTTFGGYGFASEFHVERKWREARWSCPQKTGHAQV